MTNYNEYKSVTGITTRQMINAVAEEFPRFSKIQSSMCSNTEYGICLLPEAEKILVEKFGSAPGLNITEGVEERKSPAAPKPDKRKKRNRLVVRLDDDTARRVRTMMTQMHFTHTQDFLEQALLSMLENWEGKE